jgi:hypothetical protein
MERNQSLEELQAEIEKNFSDILVAIGKTFGMYKLLRWLNNLLSKK